MGRLTIANRKEISTGEELKGLIKTSKSMSGIIKFAVRIRDRKLLQEAVEEKMNAEREAGLLLIKMSQSGERTKGGRPAKNASINTRGLTMNDLGISWDESSRWQQIARLSKIDFGRKIIAAVNRAWHQIERTKRERLTRDPLVLLENMEFRLGDCREVLRDIEDESVALVLTDPPYGEEAEPLYRWLAEWSARVLIPGGSLICYTGHWSINRDLQIFDEHLRFWWIMAMLHQQSRQLPGKWLVAGWKPVLWYVKNNRRGKSYVYDVLRTSKRDKEQHDWGQGEAGVGDLIEKLTERKELILDPFAGTCLWGKMASCLGRRWIGSDIVEGGAEQIMAEELTA